MNCLVSFSTPNYRTYQNSLADTKDIGSFDKVYSYTENDIDSEFYNKNKRVFDCGRGYGYWLWKPYLLLKTMDSLQDGDVVFYSDSKARFTNSCSPIFDICKDIILFGTEYPLRKFTKKDCFVIMQADTNEYNDSKMVNAAFQCYRKNKESIDFLKEYLYWCENYDVISDDTNLYGPNYPEFLDHRHDQSIVSILAKKYNIELHRDLSQFGNIFMNDYSDKYGQIIQHR